MERMPRPPRRESESGYHHVMNRGVDRQPIFTSDADRLDFGRELEWMHENLDVTTVAYCLMDNHFHLIVRAPDGSLSEAMHHTGSVYAHRHNARTNRTGPVFGARFHSIPIEDDAYLLSATRYIHLNPLDLPGTDHPIDYRWSSYRTYLGLRAAPSFLDTDPVMGLVGGSIERLVAFTEERLRGVDKGLGPRPTGDAPPTLVEIMAIIRCAIAVEDITRGSDEGSLRGLERTLLILLTVRESNPWLRRAMHAGLRFPSRGAARTARHRAEQRLADPTVRRLLEWCEASLRPNGRAAA